MIRKQFPTSFDVEQAITFHTSDYDALRVFAQSLGVITYGSAKNHISDFFSCLLLGHDDYLQLRIIAQGAEPSTSISGFMLRHTLHEVDIDLLCEDIVQLRNKLSERQEAFVKRGSPVPAIGLPLRDQNNNKVTVHFGYQRVIPGRVELMQQVDSHVDLTLEKIGQTQWQAICYPSANQDVKTVQKLFRHMAGGQYEAYTISLERFTRKQRIEFFDNLLNHYSDGKGWMFEQVTGITIKRPVQDTKKNELAQDDDEADLLFHEDGEDTVVEVGSEYVKSITQAILEGKDLRTNKFVQDCEKEGFYFLSMTLHLTNTRTPEAVRVTVRFKLSPQMFEVLLTKMMVEDEMGTRDTVFSEERQQQILREFWDVSHGIWRQIYNRIPRQPKEQASIADVLEAGELDVEIQ